MGGKMKGNAAAGYNSRRRWMNMYVMMAIVCAAFVCGILGVMGFHRLKERNILNLLIKEKHHQILSLHHLLQKEREENQEAKKKTEEMKVKIFNLRAQKSDLNNRVLQMQSELSSLRDEQRTVGLAFQEKQNEANLLRDQYMQIKDKKPRLEALTEALKQKEDEIEDLKHRLQLEKVTKVGSTSMDQHSILPANKSSEEHGRSETNSKEEVNKLENSQERTSEDKDLEMRGNSNGTYKFRGKHRHGYLKRAKGKRWGTMDTQTEEQRSYQSMGNSTRLQNESVSQNHQLEKDDKLLHESKHEQDDDTRHGIAKFDESSWKETVDSQVGQEEVAERNDKPQMELGEKSEDKELGDEPEY